MKWQSRSKLIPESEFCSAFRTPIRTGFCQMLVAQVVSKPREAVHPEELPAVGKLAGCGLRISAVRCTAELHHLLLLWLNIPPTSRAVDSCQGKDDGVMEIVFLRFLRRSSFCF